MKRQTASTGRLRKVSQDTLEKLKCNRLKPITKGTVNLINERAQGLALPDSFGAALNPVLTEGEYILPAMVRADIPKEQPRVLIGNRQCAQPYSASLFNASALSFGPIGKPFILALNEAAHQGAFFQNTGQTGLTPYHFNVDMDIESPDFYCDKFFDALSSREYPKIQAAGDIVWQIGNGYFSCRKIDGSFDKALFRQKALLPNIKMIEIKLSQGVSPLKQMPVKEVTPGMVKLMGINWEGQAKANGDCAGFRSPMEILELLQTLRELSDGKPVGMKMGISHRHYFLSLCKAMLKTGIYPDFITVDGMEGGTAAAPSNTLGLIGTPLKDAVLFVHNALVGTKLRKHIKIIASSQVFTEVEMFLLLARGADLFASARGFMLASGCDQQQECHMGTCMRGIATQNPELQKNFNIAINRERMYFYHEQTLQAFQELLSIAGIAEPAQITPDLVQKKWQAGASKPLSEIYEYLKEGALLAPLPWLLPAGYRKAWHHASARKAFADM